MFTTTARLRLNVGILGSGLLGYSVGQEILVEKRGDRYYDRLGLELDKNWLDFDIHDRELANGGEKLQTSNRRAAEF